MGRYQIVSWSLNCTCQVPRQGNGGVCEGDALRSLCSPMPRHWQGQTEQQNHSSIAGWHWDSQMIVFCECGLTVPFERTSTCSSEDLFMSRLVWTQLNSTLLSNMAYILDIWHEWNFSPLSPTLCKHWCVSSLSVEKIHPLLPCNIPPSRVLALLFVLQQSQFLEVAGGCKQRAQCGVPLVQLWELLQVHLCSFWVLSIQMHMQPLKTRDRSDGTLEPWISFFGLDFFFGFYCEVFFCLFFFSDFILHLCTEPSIVSECDVTLEQMWSMKNVIF